MSALPQPNVRDVVNPAAKLPVSPDNTTLRNSQLTSSTKNYRKTSQLSPKKSSSVLLQLLRLLERGSSYVAGSLIFASIGVYLATVRIPQQWSQEYEKLEALQRQERDLVAVDESLKYEIAQQAEQPELAMSGIAPENTLFVKPNSIKPQQKSKLANQQPAWQSRPLGY